jgi:tRNA dimethylallyltransferase
MRPAILIHGPTASGKTRLAIELAKRFGGEIVNADAMQVYAGLNVLTARPDPREIADAPHHLFGYVDAAERYSAGRWLRDAAAKIAELRAAQIMPIVVGGTGLYLSGLTDGLSDIPEIPADVRAAARAQAAKDVGAAHSELARADPKAAARIAPGDTQRVARGLEVLAATGRTLTSYQVGAEPVLPAGEWLGVALSLPREPLYGRINARVHAMVKSGALEEARTLWRRGIDRDAPVMRAHGMPGFCEYFEGKIALEEAVERCQRDTRRYAKRQMTWIAHQFTLWPRVPSDRLEVRVRVISALYDEIDRAPAKR